MTGRIEEIKETRAREEYAAIRAFYIHFLIYAAVIGLLVVINFLIGGKFWSQWPALGWGIGVLAHGYGAFVTKPKQLAAWEAAQIKSLTGQSAG